MRFGLFTLALVIATTAAFQTLAEHRPGPPVVVAAVPTMFPPQYQLNSKGEPVGFAIDVMNLLAKKAGITVRYQLEKDWEAVFQTMQEGRADIVPNMGITDERRQDLLFTRPYETIRVSVFTRSGQSDIRRLEDLSGQRVAHVSLNVAGSLLQEHDYLDTVEYSDVATAFFDLLAGRVDALAYPEATIDSLLANADMKNRLKKVDQPLAVIERGVAVRTDLPELAQLLDHHLGQLQGTPEFSAIYHTWYGGRDSGPRTSSILLAVGAASGLLLLVFFVRRKKALLPPGRQLTAPGFTLSPAGKSSRDRILVLATIMALATIGVAGTAITALYHTAIEEQKQSLSQMAKHHAGFLEAVAAFDRKWSPDYPGGPLEATLSQLKDAVEPFTSEEELVLGQRNGDRIIFLLRRHQDVISAPDWLPFDSPIAEPMRLALSGQSGTIIAPDYRGVMSLTAFEPATSIGLGLVVKIDLALVRQPFIRAGFWLLLGSLAVAAVGVWIFVRIGNPIISRIQESEARLQSLMDATPAVIFIKDRRGRYVQVNHAFLEAIELNQKLVINHDDTDIFDPDTASRILEDDLHIIERGRPEQIEEIIPVKGVIKEFLTTKFPICDYRGDVVAIGGIAIDVSENRRNIRALRAVTAVNRILVHSLEEKELLEGICRAIVEEGGYALAWVGLAIRDKAKTIKLAASTGMTPGMMEGMELSWNGDTGRPGPAGRAIRDGRPALNEAGERILGFEATLALPLVSRGKVSGALVIHSDQRQAFGEEAVELLLGLADDLAYGMAAIRERESRRRTEEKLRASEKRFRSLVMNVPAITYASALDEISATSWISPQAIKILGVDPDEFIRKPDLWANMLHEEDRERVLAQVEACREAWQPLSIEYRMVRPDGQVVWIRDEASLVFDEQGRPSMLQGVMLDITRHREAETALLRREAVLEAVSQSVERLFELPDWREAAPEILALLGTKMNASRTYIFENHVSPEGGLLTSQRFEWYAEGIPSMSGRPELENYDWKGQGITHMHDTLAQGLTFAGPVKEMPDAERGILESQGIVSAILVPVFVQGLWWGFMGLDDCSRERKWSESTREGLHAVADALGGAIRRLEIEQYLRASIEDQNVISDMLRLSLWEAPLEKVLEDALDLIIGRPSPHMLDRGCIYLWDQEARVLRLTAEQGMPNAAIKNCREIHLDACLCGKAAMSSGVTLIPAGAKGACPGMPGDGHYCIPIISGRTLLGLLNLFLSGAHAPGKGEEKFLQAVADTLAGIIRRKKVEVSLRESDARMRAVTQSTTDGIIGADSQGRIIAWNRGAADIFGWEEAEILGRPVTDIMPESFREAHTAAVQKAAEGGELHLLGRTLELRGLKRDGREFPLELSLGLWTAQGERFFSAIVRDISERKETELQLWQAQKSESLGNLAGGIAHDFNNMLLPIMALTEMTMDELPEDSRGRQRLEKVLQASHRAKDLISRILLFSRKEEPRQEKLELKQLIEESVELLRSTIPSSMEIHSDLQEGIGAALVDPSQIQAVLMNLGSNAAAAMRERTGRLDIRLEKVKDPKTLSRSVPGLDPDRAYARIRVKDDGTGMDARVMERIFDPFFTTKKVGEGTGLGLSIVHGIITHHGGAIRVHSRIGKGTTFEIYLPLLEDEGL